MKIKIMIMLAIVIGLLAFTTTKQTETIVIYSSLEQFRNNELQELLAEEFSELDIKVVYMPTGKSAAKLELEGSMTDANIVVGLEVGYMTKVANNLEDISGMSSIDYLDEFAPENFDNKFLVWERYAGAFVIDENALNELNLPIPKTYEDLLDPQYKNLIAMPDPKSSGTGYFFVKNQINSLGEEGAFEYFDKLESNIKQFTESGSGPLKLLNQGEIAIGLGMTFQAINEINSGRDYSIIFPPEGSPYSFSAVGLIKGNKGNTEVESVFDYLIHEFIKIDKEKFSPELIYKGQIITVENYPENINYSDMSGIEDMEEKERILDQWKY